MLHNQWVYHSEFENSRYDILSIQSDKLWINYQTKSSEVITR